MQLLPNFFPIFECRNGVTILCTHEHPFGRQCPEVTRDGEVSNSLTREMMGFVGVEKLIH